MTWAVRVITRAAARMASRITAGIGLAPARSAAAAAWRASSSFITATTARDATSPSGSLRQVAGQVLLHLSFGFHHEPQADRIVCSSGQQANGEGSGVPHRVEQTGAPAQFGQPLLGPCQMVGFLAACRLHLLAQLRCPGRQRLGCVQGLGTNLADVVDPHQRARQTALFRIQGSA